MSITFNPLEDKFDVYTPESFSYCRVAEGRTLYIPQCQHMIVWNFILVEGNLLLDGNLVII